MITGFIQPQDPRWRWFLKHGRYDVYHLPEYISLTAKYEGGEPIAFYAEEDGAVFIVPLIIRKIPASLGVANGWCDAITPYGYPTPVITSSDKALLERFIEAFHEAGAERGIITVFLRLHPLMPLENRVLEKYGELINHGKTIYIDLSLSHEEMWRQVCKDHREKIRRLKRLGFTATMDDWRLFNHFIDIYRMTMRRVSASKFYRFPDGYFEELRDALGEHLHLCTVLSPNGEVAAAGLITEANGIVQVHLGGSDDRYFKLAPSKLKYDFVRRWAKDSKNNFVLYGGGVGCQEDSLFKFKAGFSKLTADFYTYRMVLDSRKYTALKRLCFEQYGNMASLERRTDSFFPEYRRAYA